jgi:hypothetical protein
MIPLGETKMLVPAPAWDYNALMSPYDDNRTLDPGLTALTLRARRQAAGRYPFVERALRGQRRWVVAAGVLAGGVALWRRLRPASRLS